METVQPHEKQGVIVDDKDHTEANVEFNNLSDIEIDSAFARRQGSIWTIVGCVSQPPYHILPLSY